MPRVLAVVLAVCCALSMGIAAVPTTDAPSAATAPAQQGCSNDDPHVVCLSGTSNQLALNGSDVVVASSDDAALDVASAVEVDVESTSARLSSEAVRAAYERAASDERRAILERYTATLRNRTDDLRERERAALAAYNDGRISTGEYLRRLAAVDAAADRLWETSQFVRQNWAQVTGQYNRDPSTVVRADLYGLRGPVRDRLQRAFAGDRDPLAVHVSTTDSGFALAAFDEVDGRETFVREVYLGDVRRQSTGGDLYGGNAISAANRIEELYPWTFSGPGITIRGNVNAYRAPRDHAHGSTTVFLDGESGRVFAEHRESYLDRLPIRSTNATNGSTGLTVTLGMTHRGGPLNVTVTDADGDRVDAEITVGDRSIGATGADGTLWTVAPYGSILTVEARHDGETVRIQRFPFN